ncbi:MerR family transcriptional regulator [Desulfotomaculum copahuensis]|uniref:MerR family transcriptional regulator n=1 Tax=Desulfotomaculum copahuensis TaxID=1838280 RepID=A0A1B7LKS1_9FIRM|nr:MerR family transcriptional regulator [Desulfotomaculum copahuensis]OAT87133.1 MerR family transcriptional regulator [Desulfotomaculum copahuensis]
MAYTVKAVANMTGVSIRTLHHYDQIGLLKPASLTPAGYRLYSDADIDKLQQVLFFKELEFSLEEIKVILDRPDFDRKKALAAHRELLLEKKKRLEELIGLVDTTLENLERGKSMTGKEFFAPFDMKKIEEAKEKYRDEARQKYDPKLVAESGEKTSRYTEADWRAIHEQEMSIYRRVAAAMDAGKDPADTEVQEAIGERYREINERYYTCTPQIFRGLGEMYVADSRFTAFYERLRPGMAEFMRQAMAVYSDSLEKRGV